MCVAQRLRWFLKDKLYYHKQERGRENSKIAIFITICGYLLIAIIL